MYRDIIEINASAPRTFDILFKDGLRGTMFIDVPFCTGVFEILKDDAMVSEAFIENGVITWKNDLISHPTQFTKKLAVAQIEPIF